MPVRIGSVVVDCRDFAVMMRFWQEALHYAPREPPEPGWVVLTDPRGRGPNLSLQQDDEVRPTPNRLHLDLYTEDRAAEVARLLRLGARRHRDPEPGEDFVVLADPEANLFCVVEKRDAASAASPNR